MFTSFSDEVAAKVGLEGAIILSKFYFWIKHNQANDRNFYDGKYWTFNSYKALEKLFSYWGSRKICREIDKLVDAGYLEKGNFNRSPYDKTNWYTLTDEAIKVLSTPANIDLSKSVNRVTENDQSIYQNEQIELPKSVNRATASGKPIPVYNTVYNTVSRDDDDDSACAREEAPSATSDVDEGLGHVIKTYVDNIQPDASAAVIEKLTALYDQYRGPWCLKAIDLMVEHGGRSISYMRAILDRRARTGYWTKQEREAQRNAGGWNGQTTATVREETDEERKAREEREAQEAIEAVARYEAELAAQAEREASAPPGYIPPAIERRLAAKGAG